MKLKRNSYIALISTVLLFFSVILLGITDSITRISDAKPKVKSSEPVAEIPEGNLYLSDFYFRDFAHLQIWAIAQDSTETMLFATRRGIISFDGTTENFLPLPAIPYKIAVHPTTGKIYVACENGFGKLTKQSDGLYTYKALAAAADSVAYSDIVFTDEKICFIGEQRITTLEPDESAPTTYSAGKSSYDSWLFVDKKLIVKSEGRFLNPKTPADVFPFLDNILADKTIRSFVVFGDLTIAISSENKFYKIEKQSTTEFIVESQKYFDESLITGIYRIDNKQFAVSTLNGGVLVLDKETGKTNHTINYRTGLPDDEIFALGTDSKGGLWISHAYGLSRADMLLPVRDFTHYPGIEGRINSLQIADNVLYAATGEGVYYLSEIKDIDEIQELVKRSENQKQTQNNTPNTDNEVITPVITPDKTETETNTEEETDGGVIERWRDKWKNRKKDKKSDDKTTEPETNTPPKTEPGTTTPEVKNTTTTVTEPIVNEPKKGYTKRKTPKKDVRREYELQSVKFAFKKIEGLNSKTVKLVNTSAGLFATSNGGLFQIVDFKATKVSDLTVHDICQGKKHIFVATSDGIYTVENSKKLTLTTYSKTKGSVVYSLAELNGKLWAGGQNAAFSILDGGTDLKTFELKTEFPEAVLVHVIDKQPYFFTDEIVFEFKAASGSMEPAELFKDVISYKSRFNFPTENAAIISEQSEIRASFGCELYEKNLKYLNLSTEFLSVFFMDDAIWSVSKSNQILRTEKTVRIVPNNLRLQIEGITQGDSVSMAYQNGETIALPYHYNKLSVKLSAPSFLKQSGVKYFYVLDSESGTTEIHGNILVLPELSYGSHEIRIFAKNSLNEESKSKIVKVEINAPFWYSAIFWVLVGIVGAALGGVIAMMLNRRKNRRMQRLNEELEAEVLRRTQKIQEQNDEIKAQNDEILDQNKQIADQNKQITKQNEEITDSIRYASRIQSAVLPSIDILTKHLAGAFIFFNPRDIVSGDFYWFDKIEDEIFIAAADCTGHGVPGGFLSMLGISFLNEIVSEKTIRAGEILDKLRDKVIKSLNQSKNSDAKDGMDIAFVKINTTTLKMEFAGANNLIFHMRNGVLEQIKPDRMPVGYHRDAKKNFTTNEVQLQKNDLIYLFSDGYVDQFSESTKRKFSKARLQELLFEIRNMKMEDQRHIVESMFHKWKGEHIQIDDILIIGLKV